MKIENVRENYQTRDCALPIIPFWQSKESPCSKSFLTFADFNASRLCLYLNLPAGTNDLDPRSQTWLWSGESCCHGDIRGSDQRKHSRGDLHYATVFRALCYTIWIAWSTLWLWPQEHVVPPTKSTTNSQQPTTIHKQWPTNNKQQTFNNNRQQPTTDKNQQPTTTNNQQPITTTNS